MRSMGWTMVAWMWLGIGCGNNPPEIPPELLAPPGDGASDGYPEGPYGVVVGDVVADLTCSSWRDPRAAGYDPAALAPLSLADLHDPAGTRGHTLVLLNTAAIWCTSCRVEHASLGRHHAELGPRGLVIWSLLYQDAARAPASAEDAAVWAKQFTVEFPFGVDPDFQLGRFGPPELAPMNLLIDARDMKLLAHFVGDQAAVMWPTIDAELEARGR